MVTRLCILLVCGYALAQPASLEQSSVSSAGENRVLVTIHELGRYSITAEADQPVFMRLVDAMAGTLAASGNTARVDALLDRGTYALRVRGDKTNRGKAELSIARYQKQVPEPGLVDRYQVHAHALKDLESYTFWVYHDGIKPFFLEVAGRALSDVRVWIAGDWQAGIARQTSQIEPEPGKPMRYFEFRQPAAAGYYKVVCYGSPPLPWAAGGDDSPLLVRHGLLQGGLSGYHAGEVSAFGHDQWWIDKSVNFAEIRTPDKQAARLTIANAGNTGSLLFSTAFTTAIASDSKVFQSSINLTYAPSDPVMRVRATPGTRFETQYYRSIAESISLPRKKGLLAIGHTPFAFDDSLETTAALYRTGSRARIENFAGPYLSSQSPLVRRIDVQQELRLFINVTEAGSYRLSERPDSSATAHYEMVPYGTASGRGKAKTSAGSISKKLTEGVYLLRVVPERKGLLDFAMTHVRAPIASNTSGPPARALPRGFVWKNLDGSRNGRVQIAQSYASLGVNITSVPVQLDASYSLSLAPGESIHLPVNATRNLHLWVNGENIEALLNDQPFDRTTVVNAGYHGLAIRNVGDRTERCHVQPVSAVPPGPLPGENDAFERQLPRLTMASPLFKDYKAQASQWALLDLDQTGLYRLETSGLLSTGLVVWARTAEQPLFSVSANGSGRNALVLETLRAGQYLVATTPNGKSAGRAGLHCEPALTDTGPELMTGGPVRVSQTAGRGVVLPVRVTEAGQYRLSNLALRNPTRYRLDDAEGWPVAEPGSSGDFQGELEPGEYKLTLLPAAVDARRVLSLERQVESAPLQGKGPHALTLNQTVEHVWRLGEADRYTLETFAASEVTITLSRGMGLSIQTADGYVNATIGGEPWQLSLPAGEHRLEVRRLDEDDRFPYTLRVATNDLLPGVEQTVTSLPAELTVRAQPGMLAEFATMGGRDVALHLIDKDGNELASEDDSRNDWNPRFTRRLFEDRYRLRIRQTGPGDGPVNVSLQTRDTRRQPEQVLPFELNLNPSRFAAADVVIVPLRVPTDGLFRLHVKGDPAEAFLESGRNTARAIDKDLIVPLRADGDYSIRLSGLTRATTVSAESLAVTTLELTGEPITLRKPGAYRLKVPDRTAYRASTMVQTTTSADQALAPTVHGIVNGYRGETWVYTARRGIELKPLSGTDAEPIALHVNEPINLRVPRKAETVTVARFGHDNHLAGLNLGREIRSLTWQTVGVDPLQSITAALGEDDGQDVLHLWPTRNEASPGNLSISHYDVSTVHQIGENGMPMNMAPEEAVRLQLPPSGEARAVATLPRGLLAFSLSEGGTADLAYAGSDHVEAVLEVVGRTLVLVNTNTESTPVFVRQANESDEPVWPLAQEGFEGWSNQAGRAHFRLPEPPSGSAWMVLGAVRESAFYTDDGRVIDAKITDRGGWAVIEHDAGYHAVLAASDERAALFSLQSSEAKPVDGSTVELGSDTEQWTVASDGARLIVAKPSRVIAMADAARSDAPSIVGPNKAFYAFGQNVSLLTRVLEPDMSNARLQLEQVAPANLESGKDNLERVLGPGHVHFYKVQVRENSRLGLGFETDGDRLDAIFFDANFQALARGPYILRDTPAGTYYLLVEGGSAPVVYRAVAYGLDGPEERIPDDVLAGFLGR